MANGALYSQCTGPLIFDIFVFCQRNDLGKTRLSGEDVLLSAASTHISAPPKETYLIDKRALPRQDQRLWARRSRFHSCLLYRQHTRGETGREMAQLNV